MKPAIAVSWCMQTLSYEFKLSTPDVLVSSKTRFNFVTLDTSSDPTNLILSIDTALNMHLMVN